MSSVPAASYSATFSSSFLANSLVWFARTWRPNANSVDDDDDADSGGGGQHEQPSPPSTAPITPLPAFLASARAALRALFSPTPAPSSTSTTTPTVTFVMGNEACDMDSMVSSLILAWYMHHTHPAGGAIQFVPIFNVERRYFALRSETVWAMQQAGLTPSDLIFLDDAPPISTWLATQQPHEATAAAPRRPFHLILTDHNKLAVHQAMLGERVVGIIDHHVDDHCYESTASGAQRIIEPVGSCTSLVSRLIHQHSPQLLRSSYVAARPCIDLLTSAILIDTHNMNAKMKKGTPVDAEELHFLAKCVRVLQCEELMRRKRDVSSLNTEQLCMLDAKRWQHAPYVVQISSVPISFETWQQQDPFVLRSLAKVLRESQYDALILMLSYHAAERGHQRDLIIFVPRSCESGDSAGKLTTEQVFQRFIACVEQSEVLRAVEEPLVRNDEAAAPAPVREDLSHLHAWAFARRYAQGNVGASRKQVGPIIDQLLAKL